MYVAVGCGCGSATEGGVGGSGLCQERLAAIAGTYFLNLNVLQRKHRIMNKVSCGF